MEVNDEIIKYIAIYGETSTKEKTTTERQAITFLK